MIKYGDIVCLGIVELVERGEWRVELIIYYRVFRIDWEYYYYCCWCLSKICLVVVVVFLLWLVNDRIFIFGYLGFELKLGEIELIGGVFVFVYLYERVRY